MTETTAADGARVSLGVDAGVATLRLTRARKRNAIDDAFLDAFADAVDRVTRDARVKVLLLEADGPSFCAGFDLDVLDGIDSEHERKARFASAIRTRLWKMSRILERLSGLEAVSVAAVQGAAAGGGFSLALACDLRVVASDARCWYPEVELGSPLSPASTRVLSRLVPTGVAREIVLCCRRLDAPRLLALGIANRVVAPADLAAEARAVVGELLAKPAAALLASKATLEAVASGHTVVRPDLIPDRDV